MNEQLIPQNNDGGSAAEPMHRSPSLLERIRAQQQREAVPTPTEATTGPFPMATMPIAPDMTGNMNTGPVQIPNYAPIASDAVSGGGGGGGLSSSFGGLSVDFGGFTAPTRNTESSQGLLSDQPAQLERSPDGYYTMSAYFRMFVTDVYTFFRSLPVPVQVLVVAFMLWIIWALF